MSNIPADPGGPEACPTSPGDDPNSQGARMLSVAADSAKQNALLVPSAVLVR